MCINGKYLAYDCKLFECVHLVHLCRAIHDELLVAKTMRNQRKVFGLLLPLCQNDRGSILISDKSALAGASKGNIGDKC